jgi:RNAse (barnase) inhibitor barstar
MKINRSIRFDENDLELSEKLGIDLNDVCRDSLKNEIERRLTPEFVELQKKKNAVLRSAKEIKPAKK